MTMQSKTQFEFIFTSRVCREGGRGRKGGRGREGGREGGE